jgi:hypothetical protein
VIALMAVMAPIGYIAWKALQRNVSAESLIRVTGPVDYPTNWSELDQRQLNHLQDGH